MRRTIFMALILLILGIVVSIVKYDVGFLRKELNHIEKEIAQCFDDLKILRAEWEYLNNPARLKKLCQNHLKQMRPIVNSQIVSYEQIEQMALKESRGNALGGILDLLVKKKHKSG